MLFNSKDTFNARLPPFIFFSFSFSKTKKASARPFKSRHPGRRKYRSKIKIQNQNVSSRKSQSCIHPKSNPKQPEAKAASIKTESAGPKRSLASLTSKPGRSLSGKLTVASKRKPMCFEVKTHGFKQRGFRIPGFHHFRSGCRHSGWSQSPES